MIDLLLQRHVQLTGDWRQALHFDCERIENGICDRPQFPNLCDKRPNRKIVKRHHYESAYDAVSLKKRVDIATTTISSTTVPNRAPVSGSISRILLIVLGILSVILLIVAIVVAVRKRWYASKTSTKHLKLANRRQDHVEGRELI